eukprot:COSAG06_NODE_848_length_11971_cov_10.199882_8_plen_94_part_00
MRAFWSLGPRYVAMLALLPTTLLGASFASADTGYVGPLAAFSVLDESASIGLAARLGRGTKHSGNPLWRHTLSRGRLGSTTATQRFSTTRPTP